MRVTPTVPNSARKARSRLTAALALCVGVFALSACSAPQPELGRGAAGNGWVAFGPFERPEATAASPVLVGPSEIRVPDGGVVRLDASELLPDERIEAESYTFTYDERDPMIAGIVQYRGVGDDGAEQSITQVLGITPTVDPEVVTRTRAYAGAPHASELAGTSELGVVAVFLEGELRPGEGVMQQLAGIDVARGTWVWAKEDLFPVYGEGRAEAYTAEEREGCATSVEAYDVATGNAIPKEDEWDGGPAGSGCLRPELPEG